MALNGTVMTGLGKGAYYIGMDVYQERFHDVLGFYPYAGTLNIDVDIAERELFQAETPCTHMDAPKKDGDYLSAVDVYPVHVTVPDTDDTVDGALLDLEITDHPDSVAEIIAPINLREAFGLKDGDTIIVEQRA